MGEDARIAETLEGVVGVSDVLWRRRWIEIHGMRVLLLLSWKGGLCRTAVIWEGALWLH